MAKRKSSTVRMGPTNNINLIRRVCGDAGDVCRGAGGGLVHEEVLDVPPGQRLDEVLGDAAAVIAPAPVAGGGRRRRRRRGGGRVAACAAAEAAAAAAVLVLRPRRRRRRRRARGGLGGEAHAREQEPGVAHRQLAGRVHRHVAVAAQDGAVLLAEQEPPLLLRDQHIVSASRSQKLNKTPAPIQRFCMRGRRRSNLADVAERRLCLLLRRRPRPRRGRRRRVEQREAAVLAGELVGAVHAAVARVAQRGLVGAAEHRRRLGRAHVALHLHLAHSLSLLVAFFPLSGDRALDGIEAAQLRA